VILNILDILIRIILPFSLSNPHFYLSFKPLRKVLSTMSLGGESSGTNAIDYSSLENVEGENNMLAAAFVTIAAIGVPTASMTRAVIHSIFLTVPNFLREIRALTSITDADLMDLIFAEAIRSRIIVSVRSCDVKGLLAIARWMKKDAGALKVHQAQQVLKFRRKAPVGFTPEQLARAQGLDLMIQDMGSKMKEYRQECDKDVAEHQQKIDLARRKLSRRERRLKRTLEPAARFDSLAKEELARLCWEKYKEDCAAHGTEPLPWTSISAAHAENTFGGTVQAEHRAAFVLDPVVAGQIDAWLESKIIGLEKGEDFRTARIFRRLLAGQGRGEDVVVPDGEEEAASETDTRGKGAEGGGEDAQHQIVGADVTVIADEEAPAGNEGEASPPQKRRSVRAKKPPPRLKLKSPGNKADKKRKRIHDPHGKE
jgi:hypothetical protein